MLHCNSFQFNCNTFYFFRTDTLLKKLLKDHESFFYHSFSVTTFTFGQNNIPTCSEPPHPARRCPEHIPKATAQVIVKCPERRRSRCNLCFDRGADSHPEETVSVVFSSGEASCPRADFEGENSRIQRESSRRVPPCPRTGCLFFPMRGSPGEPEQSTLTSCSLSSSPTPGPRPRESESVL